MIRVAAGTASVLGLTKIRMKALPTTAHFLTPGRCIFDCKFCTQAKSSAADSKLLSRISWPDFPKETAFSALKKKQDEFMRVCLQVVHSNGAEDHLTFVKEISETIHIPLSVDLKAHDIEAVRKTFKAGADVVGLPIDCANPRIYSKVKEGSFLSQINLIEQAAMEFKKRISTHLIIGLGESEKDAVSIIKKIHSLDVNLGLFAFTPVKGTLLEKEKPPTLNQYRRIQLARYLVYNDMDFVFKYDNLGNIISFGAEKEEIENIIESSAFQTTGCVGCNRPYYNESPGKALYNYPYPLSEGEYKNAINEAYCELEVENG
jgi:biotin synthase-related radical SAM superfamily protein